MYCIVSVQQHPPAGVCVLCLAIVASDPSASSIAQFALVRGRIRIQSAYPREPPYNTHLFFPMFQKLVQSLSFFFYLESSGLLCSLKQIITKGATDTFQDIIKGKREQPNVQLDERYVLNYLAKDEWDNKSDIIKNKPGL
jgi:hypothetical protein